MALNKLIQCALWLASLLSANTNLLAAAAVEAAECAVTTEPPAAALTSTVTDAPRPVTPPIVPHAPLDWAERFVGALVLSQYEAAVTAYRAAGLTPTHEFYGYTALELAITSSLRDDPRPVLFLLTEGADPHRVHARKKSNALLFALNHGHFKIAEELIKQGGAQLSYNSPCHGTPLHKAVGREHLPCIRALVARPECHNFLNLQNTNGDTALHLAAMLPNPAGVTITEVLIGAGIAFGFKNRHDDSAFDLADGCGNTAVCDLLKAENERRIKADTARRVAAAQAKVTADRAAAAERKARAKATKAAAAAEKLAARLPAHPGRADGKFDDLVPVGSATGSGEPIGPIITRLNPGGAGRWRLSNILRSDQH